MNREQYRAQVDALSFSSDFQDRTMARLAQEKERKPMKKMNLKAVLLAAAVVAAMSVTAYAAITLAPRDVAQRAGNEALAAAFEGEDAITVNETKTVGDYNVTLMGLVSGTGLSRVESLPDSVDQDKTYAVLAYARTDGADITEDVPDLTVSPLVEGYAPWRLNAWTLGGGVSSFAQEGVLYYLFECDNVEPFADHTVYLAVYPGTHTPPVRSCSALRTPPASSPPRERPLCSPCLWTRARPTPKRPKSWPASGTSPSLQRPRRPGRPFPLTGNLSSGAMEKWSPSL